MIGDLRYVDLVSPVGEIEARHELHQLGTPPLVVDWVFDRMKEEREQLRDLKQKCFKMEVSLSMYE